MALNTINVGYLANDGTGDDLREAFIKVNNNFDYLDNRIVDTSTDLENIGSGEGIYAYKGDGNFKLKSLNAGSGMTITSSANTITLASNVGIERLIFVADAGAILQGNSTGHIKLYGENNVTTRTDQEEANTIRIGLSGDNLVALDPNPQLSGQLNANSQNIVAANQISANTFTGNLTGLVHGIDIRQLGQAIDNFDLGAIKQNAKNIIEFLVFAYDINFGPLVGTEESPLVEISVDGGQIV